jgi:hypothetical protein
MKLLNLSEVGMAVCTFFATVGSLIVGLLGGWDKLASVLKKILEQLKEKEGEVK